MIKRREYISKARRSVKKSRIPDFGFGRFAVNFVKNIYTELYILWLTIMIFDFLIEFRFECLWPFYLLIRNLRDSVKYQGVAFTIGFALLVSASNLVWFLILPHNWLFFIASSLVWIQYVWQNNRGFCWGTIFLCFNFINVEALYRFKDFKTLPITLELSRTFAAHCIGYPFVTFGFAIRNYYHYSNHVRTQRAVVRLNNFCMHIMNQDYANYNYCIPITNQPENSNLVCTFAAANALNASQHSPKRPAAKQSKNVSSSTTNLTSNFSVTPTSEITTSTSTTNHISTSTTNHSSSVKISSLHKQDKENQDTNTTKDTSHRIGTTSADTTGKKLTTNCLAKNELHLMEHQITKKVSNLNDNEERSADDSRKSLYKSASKEMQAIISSSSSSGSMASVSNTTKWPNANTLTIEKPKNSNQQKSLADKPKPSSQTQSQGNYAQAKKLPDLTPKNQPKQLDSQPTPTIQTDNQNKTNSEATNKSSSSLSNSSPNKKKSTLTFAPGNQQPTNSNANTSTQKKQKPNYLANAISNPVKDEQIARLESDIKRLKADLQIARQLELDLNSKLSLANATESELRNSILRRQVDNEGLQTKLHNLVTARQQDRQSIHSLERKLQKEKKSKMALEQQLIDLANEHKQQLQNASIKQEDFSQLPNPPVRYLPIGTEYKSNNALRASTSFGVTSNSPIVESPQPTSFLMQLKQQSPFNENKRLDSGLFRANSSPNTSQGDTEMLLSALSVMQDQSSRLELSLSTETKIKMDLFTALGETKRQLELCQMLLQQRDKEVEELKCKVAELMAILPTSSPNLSNPFSFSFSSAKFLSSTDRTENSLDLSLSRSSLEDSTLASNLWGDFQRNPLLDPNVSAFPPNSDRPK